MHPLRRFRLTVGTVALSAALLAYFMAAGSVRRDGRNSDCQWPTEPAGQASDPRHLSADAEFAEDLAIRYADVHHGLRTPGFVSGEAYVAARDQCMQKLFAQIARDHGISVGLVSASLGHNRGRIDLALNLAFAVLYCLAASAMGRKIWRSYPPLEHGWVSGAIMTLFLSLAFAAGGLMLGEVWSWVAESHRIGNSHMSHRVDRLWWVQHRAALFPGALVVFWLASAQGARVRMRRYSDRIA